MQTSTPAPVTDTLFAFQGYLLRRASTVTQTVAQHCIGTQHWKSAKHQKRPLEQNVSTYFDVD